MFDLSSPYFIYHIMIFGLLGCVITFSLAYLVHEEVEDFDD